MHWLLGSQYIHACFGWAHPRRRGLCLHLTLNEFRQHPTRADRIARDPVISGHQGNDFRKPQETMR
jgi:hypothetical protein